MRDRGKFEKITGLVIILLNFVFFLYFLLTQHYPTSLVILHFLSLIVCCLWVAEPTKLFKFIKEHPWDILIIITLFSLVLIIRLYKVEIITPGMWSDEIVIGKISERLFTLPEYTPFVEDNYGHPTPLLYLTGLVINTFGRSITAIRLVSILFGALGITAFYIFLRLFFQKPTAIITSLVSIFSYSHIIISRFGYEMTAAIFFQILAIIFIYLAFKKGDKKFYAGIGLSIGAGFFTYLGFRTIAFTLLIISLFTLKKLSDVRNKILNLALILVSIFIVSLTLISYGLRHQNQIWARAVSVSVFHQNLPKEEIIKELWGNTKRTFGMFLLTGDPNPRQNPSGKTMFDLVTVGLMIPGLFFLSKKQRNIFLVSIFLTFPPFINDIFSVEFFPEFHYYGTGHPNILRLSGLIPIVYFWSAYAFEEIKNLFSKFKNKPAYLLAFSTLGIIIIMINWGWYFNQPISRFNYEVNGVRMINIVNLINKSRFKKVAASPSIIKDERVEYFLKRGITLEPFGTKSDEFSLFVLPENQLIIIDPRANLKFSQNLYNQLQKLPSNIQVKLLINPWREIDAFIIFKS